MEYSLIKSLHIVSFVAWFAGLFYLVRLFVYHTEAFGKTQIEKDILTKQYHIMESRLYRIICNPAMMLTWIFGIVMIYMNGWEWYKANIWLHFKIGFVILLTLYHLYNKRIISALKVDKRVMSPFKFRLYNEVPTLFLLTIVLLAVYKNLLNFGYTFVGIIAFAIILFLIAKIYRKQRLRKK
mgnify:CR=1 FL=1